MSQYKQILKVLKNMLIFLFAKYIFFFLINGDVSDSFCGIYPVSLFVCVFALMLDLNVFLQMSLIPVFP